MPYIQIKTKSPVLILMIPTVKEQIYDRYLKAYKKGAFNYIKEDPTPDGQVVPRKYFSGGTKFFGYKLDITRSSKAMLSLKQWAGALLLLTVALGSSALAQSNSSQRSPMTEQNNSSDITTKRLEISRLLNLIDAGKPFNVINSAGYRIIELIDKDTLDLLFDKDYHWKAPVKRIIDKIGNPEIFILFQNKVKMVAEQTNTTSQVTPNQTSPIRSDEELYRIIKSGPNDYRIGGRISPGIGLENAVSAFNNLRNRYGLDFHALNMALDGVGLYGEDSREVFSSLINMLKHTSIKDKDCINNLQSSIIRTALAINTPEIYRNVAMEIPGLNSVIQTWSNIDAQLYAYSRLKNFIPSQNLLENLDQLLTRNWLSNNLNQMSDDDLITLVSVEHEMWANHNAKGIRADILELLGRDSTRARKFIENDLSGGVDWGSDAYGQIQYSVILTNHTHFALTAQPLWAVTNLLSNLSNDLLVKFIDSNNSLIQSAASELLGKRTFTIDESLRLMHSSSANASLTILSGLESRASRPQMYPNLFGEAPSAGQVRQFLQSKDRFERYVGFLALLNYNTEIKYIDNLQAYMEMVSSFKKSVDEDGGEHKRIYLDFLRFIMDSPFRNEGFSLEQQGNIDLINKFFDYFSQELGSSYDTAGLFRMFLSVKIPMIIQHLTDIKFYQRHYDQGTDFYLLEQFFDAISSEDGAAVKNFVFGYAENKDPNKGSAYTLEVLSLFEALKRLRYDKPDFYSRYVDYNHKINRDDLSRPILEALREIEKNKAMLHSTERSSNAAMVALKALDRIINKFRDEFYIKGFWHLTFNDETVILSGSYNLIAERHPKSDKYALRVENALTNLKDTFEIFSDVEKAKLWANGAAYKDKFIGIESDIVEEAKNDVLEGRFTEEMAMYLKMNEAEALKNIDEIRKSVVALRNSAGMTTKLLVENMRIIQGSGMLSSFEIHPITDQNAGHRLGYGKAGSITFIVTDIGYSEGLMKALSETSHKGFYAWRSILSGGTNDGNLLYKSPMIRIQTKRRPFKS